MEKIYSIACKLITPAVILTGRVIRVFNAILCRHFSNKIQKAGTLLIRVFQTTTIVMNSGARAKERRKPWPGLQYHTK